MQTYTIPRTDLTVSRIAYGCMKLGGRWDSSALLPEQQQAAVDVVLTAYQAGMTLFDHADIYTRGKSEAAFAAVWAAEPGLRERIVLQSKCGIRFADDPHPGAPPRYDFSYEHIVRSVEGSLTRLQTEYLDILLLHRPDPLVEPEEVARAFSALHAAGKVRYFGVSNHSASQIELLQSYVEQPLVVNQVQLSLHHMHLINVGVVANIERPRYAHAAGTLDYCRQHDILVQAWSPVAGGNLFNPPPELPKHAHTLARLITVMAVEKNTTREAIALAWLLRHPAGIQPIIGTTRPERVLAAAKADAVTLSREEWYRLFNAARGARLP